MRLMISGNPSVPLLLSVVTVATLCGCTSSGSGGGSPAWVPTHTPDLAAFRRAVYDGPQRRRVLVGQVVTESGNPWPLAHVVAYRPQAQAWWNWGPSGPGIPPRDVPVAADGTFVVRGWPESLAIELNDGPPGSTVSYGTFYSLAANWPPNDGAATESARPAEQWTSGTVVPGRLDGRPAVRFVINEGAFRGSVPKREGALLYSRGPAPGAVPYTGPVHWGALIASSREPGLVVVPVTGIYGYSVAGTSGGSLLRAGDTVGFVAVGPDTYQVWYPGPVKGGTRDASIKPGEWRLGAIAPPGWLEWAEGVQTDSERR